MIDITFKRNGFIVQGHAMHGPAGQDIVCAAVSATATMTANGLLNWADLDGKVEIKEADGFLAVTIPSDRPTIQALALIDSFASAALQILAEAPDAVEVHAEDVEMEVEAWTDTANGTD